MAAPREQATRPPVTVVIPFAGGTAAAVEAVEAIGRLQVRPGDELIVVDNGGESGIGAMAGQLGARTMATARRSSYHARNVGAAAGSADWLLFLDADCVPVASLLDAYFEPAPDPAAGAVAGAVLAVEASDAVLARYARSRGLLDQDSFMTREHPFAVTANLLVRRRAFDALGGFEAVRSGGDVDFSWRLEDAGWAIEARPAAVARHSHRERLLPFLRQRVRYGAGAAWLERRYPGRRPKPRPLCGAARSSAGVVTEALRGRREEALMRAIDAIAYGAHALGRRFPNESR